MKNNKYPLTDLEIPITVIEKFGPFHEYAQDASMVSIELKNGTVISGVVIVYPNYVGAIEGENDLIFSPKEVIKVFQTEDDLKKEIKIKLVMVV